MTMRLNRFNACSKMRHRLSIYRFSIFLLLRALSTTVKKKIWASRAVARKRLWLRQSPWLDSLLMKKNNNNNKNRKNKFWGKSLGLPATGFGPGTLFSKVPKCFRSWGPFFESHGKFSGPESHSKISNLTITELFYSHILNMNRGSLHTRSLGVYTFLLFDTD